MAAASHMHLQLLVAVLFFSALSAQSTGTSTDGLGIDHCAKCGNITDTGLSKGTISQCVMKIPDVTNIRASVFSCNCQPRFTGDGITCNDFDECKERTDNCDSHAYCKNTVGSFECECKSGYSGPGIICTDIDECAEAGSEKNVRDIYCNGVGECVNTAGSYRCQCGTGYVPDVNGTSCIDIDECAEAGSEKNARDIYCNGVGNCVNTAGSYRCECGTGYVLDANGTSCIDIDECKERTDNCNNHAICKNTAGSFDCTCKGGYHGTGVVCTPDSSLNKDKGQTSHSALLYKYHRLNQERLQLVLKHEEILKRCVNLLQGKQIQTQRKRRGVFDEDVKNIESLKKMIAILDAKNAQLALQNHRLDLNCSG